MIKKSDFSIKYNKKCAELHRLGRLHCLKGLDPQSTDTDYEDGYGHQYEKEAKQEAKT